MKFNKLFFAAVAFATLAMVGCKGGKNEPTPVPTPEDEEVAPEMPAISNPEAGKTTIAIYAEVCPRGAYLVGSNQGYNINDDALSFEAMNSAGAANWYVLTIDYAADLQVKAIARPSDEETPFSWSYQWGKNYDANDPGDLDESVENTKILGGTGEFVFENQGEVKLANVADGGVVYVWVKNWKTSPIIEDKKLETCWAKTNWDNGSDWTWREMTKVGDGVFEIEAVWGGNGCNIAETEGGADAWYPTDNAAVTLVDGPEAGDKVKITFTSVKGNVGTLEIKLVEKGEVAPLEYMDITVTGINVPAEWEHCYIWAWNDKDGNYTGGNWPGEELTIVDNQVSKSFTNVAKPLKVIFSNGEGAQTNDIVVETEDAIDITANMK